MPFQDQSGAPALPKLTAEGAVPVAALAAEDDPAAFLARLVWEVAELRRVYCEATDQFFKEHPADAGTE